MLVNYIMNNNSNNMNNYNSNNYNNENLGNNGKYYYSQTEELLKFFCFFGIFITGVMEYFNKNKTVLDIAKNPYFIGAGIMSVASLITFLTFKTKQIDYTFPAAFLYVTSKLISLYFQSSNVNLDGSYKANDDDRVLQNAGSSAINITRNLSKNKLGL